MERWSGRLALVTGAGSGIGAALTRRLVKEGMRVVGVDLNVEKVQALGEELKGQPGLVIPLKCDITKDDQVLHMFQRIAQKYGGVDVCVNNVGIMHNLTLMNGTPEEWRRMMDINVIALCLCTREAAKSMLERGVDDGHIIHINSVAGHQVANFPSMHFYTASKYAVTALTEGMRQELRQTNTNIRISSISPGVVRTEIRDTWLDTEATNKFYHEYPSLKPEDIVSSVMHALAAPPHVQIHDVMVRNTRQQY
ncbi:dehydrogenase/reductase SDR family member 11-like [Portunus trituberculatus]|uniref:Dehydrogenase/reductase SDR family member 11 n=1 Tax=Portunus trituberculatus TaxID=210409 RepID=A0A5B7EI60_PORTR|nr:dehydrogenase/reductase SDR family member 11-like [Portunus trituberculatus]XP_045130013.1 dehydrogenase/reductase SDR family member 11-like [Portunus trituberculatus]MPC32866.1 Dehydrogenase/reductase SDR family member 11 [Portunus trituberculatus]